MVLRKLRWLPAAVLAAVAAVLSPARSSAEIIIQVQETGGGTFNQTYNASNPLPSSFNTGNFSNVQITVNTTSGAGASTGHSISTTLNAAPGSTFDPSIGLQVTVTDNGFLNANPGGSGLFAGNVSNTSAFADTAVTGQANLSSPATQLGPTTATSGNSSVFSPANVSGIPDSYSITQVLGLSVNSLSNANATFTAGISTQVLANPAPVPAPPALVLALAAVPALGLRRVLRRQA